MNVGVSVGSAVGGRVGLGVGASVGSSVGFLRAPHGMLSVNNIRLVECIGQCIGSFLVLQWFML